MTRITVGTVLSMALVMMASQGISASPASGDGHSEKFVYAVHILCGFGFTSINVHNPNGRTVTLTKKGIPLEFGQIPTPPREQQQEALKPDWAFLMSCEDSAALGAVGSSGTGDVIIESRQQLDVWAVYTSRVAGGGIGETRVVRVDATRIEREPAR